MGVSTNCRKTRTKDFGAGRPAEAIRWTINLASMEFSKDRKTLTKLLRAADIEPGSDGKYSTGQILKAVFGQAGKPSSALDLKRIEEIDLDMEIKRKQRIPLDIVEEINDRVFSNIAGMLKTNRGKELSDELINDMLAEARSIGGKLKDANG